MLEASQGRASLGPQLKTTLYGLEKLTEIPYERAPAAERIRKARKAAGFDRAFVAESLGLTDMAVYDLEAYDNDAFLCISLHQLGTLADLLGVTPVDLVAPPSSIKPRQMDFPTLVHAMQAEMQKNGETIEAYSDRIGWDVASAIVDPLQAWKDWNLDGLQDVCRSVDANWLALLESWPQERAI